MRRVYKNVCPATINDTIMATNMWNNLLKNVESDNNKILYENLLNLFLQRNCSYFLNKPRKRSSGRQGLSTSCNTPALFHRYLTVKLFIIICFYTVIKLSMFLKVTKHFFVTNQPPTYLCQVNFLRIDRLITRAVLKT